ncbi:MAG TPA: L-histidine N(alpha)-methyltransferase [Thermoanaerobaculia bacterium]|jgi:L-histidine N-alpha-methyltransferase|nr:L-histidine N(alpha)-methyltransferase [Thermoanaerobaculia bacterium]
MDQSLAVDAPPVTRGRFALHQVGASSSDSFADDVRRGLTATPKFLQPHYFYDALGSALFAAISELPEYYVTRAEDEILRSKGTEIAAAFGSRVRLAELGSGNAHKTRHLIEAILARQTALDFLPVDVDPGILTSSGHELLNDYAGLSITAICGDFRRPASLLRPHLPSANENGTRTIVLFLGSSIGNLDPAAAAAMLANLRTALAPGDALFLGADLRKSPAILEPAYDDALGVTAAFNRNLLARINRELGGTFDLSTFVHRAFYNEAEGRIEMHLVSRKAQRVLIDGYDVAFAEGESIHTENSYKYDEETLHTLAEAGGFTITRRWCDSKGYFADLLMVAG